MKTHSTLTLAVLLCLGLGSVEGSSRRCCLDNLSFTLRLSHSPSQNEDSAPRRTTALKVAAAGGEIKNVHINKQSAEVSWESWEVNWEPVQPQLAGKAPAHRLCVWDLILSLLIEFLALSGNKAVLHPCAVVWSVGSAGRHTHARAHSSAFIHYWPRHDTVSEVLSQRDRDQTIIMSYGLL